MSRQAAGERGAVEQGGYLQQAAVTLLPLLHVQIPTARSSQQAVWLRDVEQAHPATVQQADGQVGGTAAAELLTRHEPGGNTTHTRVWIL